MKNDIIVCIFFVIIGYLTMSFFAVFNGYNDVRYVTRCKEHTRGEKLFPAYKLGCYLGEEVE